MIIYSPNMLKTYQTCPRKFYFQYIEKVNVPRLSTPFEKGKKIHALANYYLQGINISKIESALTQEEKDTWNLLLSNPFFQKKCYKSEFQLSFKLDNFWIGGRLDALMQENDKYYILDYKTGATPTNPKYDFQTMIYLLSADKHLKEYRSLEFIYLNLKEKNNFIIDFSEQIKPDYENQIRKICTKIDNDNIYAPNCQNCAKCEYNKLCSKEL